MSDAVANCAKTIVDGLYSAADVSVTVLSPERFPAVPFNALWWNATDYGDPSDDPEYEFVRVTAINDDVLTVTRAQESTLASIKNRPNKTYKMVAGITAQMWNDLAGTTDGSVMRVIECSGSPEGQVVAPVGRYAIDILNDVLYRKKTGSGSTGWVNI